MRLKTIRVTNHSRIGDLEIEVRDHAVIVGANDVGKSSLLRLLNLLIGTNTGRLSQELSLADLANMAVELAVEADLVDFTDAERTLFPSEISVAATDHEETLRIRLTAAVNTDDPEALDIRRWFPEAGHPRGPSREQLLAFGWRYLSATRGTSVTSFEGPNGALRTLFEAIELGVEQAQLAKLLGDFNSSLGTSSKLNELRGNVATHLSKAMPRIVSKEDLAVRTAADPEQDVLGSVTMFFKNGDDHVPMSEQSDGLRQLMSMTLFDLAVGTANIVAIDEPELHLHPSSQRTVAGLFGEAGNQKILVTHSPYIVQRFEPSQIIAVNRDGDCHQIADAKLSAVEKERANWWSPRLLEGLSARFAIIVEGPSDRVIVEAVANLKGISLDRLGAVIIDLDGAMKFPHVYKLIGKDGFSVHILGLVDEKEKAIWQGAIGGKPKHVFGESIWVSTPDIEYEYSEAFTGPGAARALIAAGFCREQAILSSCEVEVLEDVTVPAIASYCRNDKISAAVAIASQLDLETAANITSVNGLLEKLRSLGAR